MALSVYTSQIYDIYGNAAVAGAGIVAAFIMALAASAVASAYRKFREGRLFDVLAQSKTIFNPKTDHYRDQVFRIQDMFHPMSHRLEHKTFQNCDIIGPGVIMFEDGVTLHNPQFVDCGDVIFPPVGTRLTSVLVLKHCTFRNCRFFRTAPLTSSAAVLDSFVAMGARDPRLRGASQSLEP